MATFYVNCLRVVSLHLPSMVVAGVSGISPKSSLELELDREAVVAWLA